MKERIAISLVSLLLLFLGGCAFIPGGGWFQQRHDCGLKCPANSTCEVQNSGVFTASYACKCKWPAKDQWWAWEGHPCPPQPTPSPKEP